MKLLPSIAETGIKPVVILNRATYHKILEEEDERPALSWSKARLTEAMK